MIEALFSMSVIVFAVALFVVMLTLCGVVSLWVATMSFLEKVFGSMKK